MFITFWPFWADRAGDPKISKTILRDNRPPCACVQSMNQSGHLSWLAGCCVTYVVQKFMLQVSGRTDTLAFKRTPKSMTVMNSSHSGLQFGTKHEYSSSSGSWDMKNGALYHIFTNSGAIFRWTENRLPKIAFARFCQTYLSTYSWSKSPPLAWYPSWHNHRYPSRLPPPVYRVVNDKYYFECKVHLPGRAFLPITYWSHLWWRL